MWAIARSRKSTKKSGRQFRREVAFAERKSTCVVGLGSIVAARPHFFDELKRPRDVIDVLGVHLKGKVEGGRREEMGCRRWG